MVYPDGRQVHAPKALCELQGYVFDAWMRMAEIFDKLDANGDGRIERAEMQEHRRHKRHHGLDSE